MTEWINIRDRLPELNTIVLVVVKESKISIRLGHLELFEGRIEWFTPYCCCAEYAHECVTHWAELLLLPEEL